MLGPFSRHVCVIFRTWTGTGHPKNTTCEIHVCRLEFGNFTTCFTIFFSVCFCESRLRQVQGTKKYRARYVEHQKMNFTICFVLAAARPDQGQTRARQSFCFQHLHKTGWTRLSDRGGHASRLFFPPPLPLPSSFSEGGARLSRAEQCSSRPTCDALPPLEPGSALPLPFVFPLLLLVSRKVVSRPGCQP